MSCLLILPPSVSMANEELSSLTGKALTISHGTDTERKPSDPECLLEPLSATPERVAIMVTEHERDRAEAHLDEYCSGGAGGPPSEGRNAKEAGSRRSASGMPGRRSFPSANDAFGGDSVGLFPGWNPGIPVSQPPPSYAGCFLPGTRILTPTGERNIEDLRIGDLVATEAGDRPIRFIPRQTFRRANGDAWSKGVAPIAIRAGALGEGLPTRTLLLSPFHALFLDGRLVEAGQLVNGRTIVSVDHPGDILEYLSIELETHGLIHANGVPVETFRPSHILAREKFDNFAEYVDLYPGEEYRSFPAYARYKGKDAIRVRLLTALRLPRHAQPDRGL